MPEPEVMPAVDAAKRFVQAIHAHSMAMMLKLDLTIPQLRTLAMIRRLGRGNGRQLAAALRVTPGAIVAICDHLEARGYVCRVTDSTDRRITWFELTDRARDLLRPTPTSITARSRTRALIASLSECERDGFVKIADAFVEALASVLEEDSPGRVLS